MKIDLVRQLKKVFDEEKKRTDKAKIIALNRAGKSALAQTVMFIRKTYNIKSSDLKKELKVSRAGKGKDRFRITVSHKAIGLIKYGAAKQTKKGVNATVSKGNRQKFPSAFITTVGKGYHRGVFKREGKERLPIKELYGPSAMQLMSSKEAQEYIEKIFNEKFVKELQSALKYAK